MAESVKWAILGDYAVVVVVGHPDDEGFDAWLRVYAEITDNLRGLIVHVTGSGPDAQQRGRLTRLVQDQDIRYQTAVVCDSVLLRGAMNAINWFMRSQTSAAVAFAPSHLDKVFDHISLPRGERARMASTIADLTGKPVQARADVHAKL